MTQIRPRVYECRFSGRGGARERSMDGLKEGPVANGLKSTCFIIFRIVIIISIIISVMMMIGTMIR